MWVVRCGLREKTANDQRRTINEQQSNLKRKDARFRKIKISNRRI